MRTFNRIMCSAMPLALLLLAACGGNGASAPAAVTTTGYSAGGTVSGLIGTVVLQDNGGDNLTLTANGNFTFATNILNGNTYNVTVLTQPTGLTCSVSTGSGTVSGSNVTNVAVVCSPNSYSVGGNVSGLTGSVVLQDNNGDNLSVSANGAITFASQLAFGSPYSVTVLTQPVGQSCSLATNTGTMGAAAVTNVAITCVTNTYTIGGTVSKLNGSMVLQDNNGDNLAVAVNGPFNFATAVAYGSPYSVTVLSQPAGQFCSVVSGSGSVTANVGNVAIACASLMGGTVQGTALNLTSTSVVSTLAGSGGAGSLDGTGTAATFDGPFGTTTDGINLYVVDNCNTTSNDIRKVVIATGVVTTLAGSAVQGSADGTGLAATFSCPAAITTDGSALYVTDQGNNIIRKIAPASGTLANMTSANAVVTTLAGSGVAGALDGTGTAASFTGPSGITSDGTNLYVVDFLNHKIRRIAPASGTLAAMTSANAVVTSLTEGGYGTSDGTGTVAMFKYPNGIVTDGTNLYVADTSNHKIRRIAPASGTLAAMTSANAVVTSLTGAADTAMAPGAADGAGTAATFRQPYSITTDGTSLYVADGGNYKIRRIAPVSGALSAMTSANATVSSITGAWGVASVAGAVNGPASGATFNFPGGIVTDGSSLYVSDYVNNLIRKIQ